jgi:twitching motility two-component system response regulator PilG
MALRSSAAKANQIMREVVAATRLGQKSLARTLLRQLEEHDPNNEQALLWAAALAETPEEATSHLERVLAINPNNQQAINVLAMHRLNAPSTRPAPAPLDSLRREAPSAAPRTPPPAPNAGFEAPSSHHPSYAPQIEAKHELGWQSRSGPALEPVPASRVSPVPVAAPPRPTQVEAPRLANSPNPASRVISFQDLLKKGWTCPLCETPAPQIHRKCPRCSALLALDDLQALAENRGVDEKLLNNAVENWTRRVTAEPSFEGWLNLARVYFNLNRSAEALPCLTKALELRPEESGLRRTVEQLQQRRLVLAVDDSLTLRRILSIMLERHGYRVLSAADGMQALALPNEQVPDLILLDITMPRMDGYQVCKVIRQNPYTKHIPVVMLSGNDGFFDKVKGKLAGAADYITKPFEEKPLADAVEKHLRACGKSSR